MTVQDWKVEEVDKKIVAEHLKDFHCYEFNDRRALNVEDFMQEHFPYSVRDIEDKKYGLETDTVRERVPKIRKLLREVLRYCQDNSIPIVKVLDFNEDNKPEWRICKPNQEQLNYLKFNRWYNSAEGFVNKALMQGNLIGNLEIDEVIKELKETIKEKQLVRIKRANKKLKKEVENER